MSLQEPYVARTTLKNPKFCSRRATEGTVRCAGNPKTSQRKREGHVMLRHYCPPLFIYNCFILRARKRCFMPDSDKFSPSTPTKWDLRIVYDAAKIYERELLDRSLLIIYLDRSFGVYSYTVHFKEKNFMHLTGLRHRYIRNFSPARFFHLALSKRLSSKEYQLVDDDTTRLKLDILGSVFNDIMHANMIGTYNNYGPLLFTDQVVGTVHSAVGFVHDNRDGFNYPNTLLNVDVRQRLRNHYQIGAILRKKSSENAYSEITYLVKGIHWESLQFPDEINCFKNLVVLESEKRERNKKQHQ